MTKKADAATDIAFRGVQGVQEFQEVAISKPEHWTLDSVSPVGFCLKN